MRIAFHPYNRFYRPQLEPVFRLLKDQFPCLLTESVEEIIAFKPQILLVADNRYYLYRSRLPGTIIVWVRHGFVSKNVLERSINGCDFACISSPWLAEHYRSRGWRPRLGYWLTGFISMDEVLAPPEWSPPPPLPADFASGRETLLYAPTWNRHFSSVDLLGPGWIERLRRAAPDLNLIIKPHPYIPRLFPKAYGCWREEAQRVPRVHLVEDWDASIYPYFNSADILLSDASSVIFYYLAMNRPIVLMNNPRRFRDLNAYDSQGLEWAWRDMGEEIENESQLLPAIERARHHPEEKADRRLLYRERIFAGTLDGRSAERLADRIKTLIAPQAADETWVRLAWNSAHAFGRLDQKERRQARFFRRFLKLGFHLERWPALKHRLNLIRRRWLRRIE